MKTTAIVVQISDAQHPALVLTPDTRSTAAADALVEQLRERGYADIDLTGQQPPVALDRWAIRLVRGRLSQITSQRGAWWTSPELLPPLDRQWTRAACPNRRALVMAADASVSDADDHTARRAALAAAAHAGHLVGAILPIRGSLA